GILFASKVRSTDGNTTFGSAVHISDEHNFTDNLEPRITLNYKLAHHFFERWLYVIEPSYGIQKYGKLAIGASEVGPARWYGINQELFYKYSDCVDLGTRLEWFQDHDHFQFGVPINIFSGRDYLSWT